MTKKIMLFAMAALAMFLSSCKSQGDKIKEIKLFPVMSGKDYEYVDKDGKIVINPQFAQASVFREGLALVQSSGDKPAWGFIDENGKYAITANYTNATVFNEGIAWVVSENAAPTAIDKNGQTKFTLQSAEQVRIFSEGLAAFSKVSDDGKTKWGFVNADGKTEINPQFSNAGDFGDGKCPISNTDGKWGYIDKEGKIVINYQFDNALSFINGKAVVQTGGKFGLIDADGKYSINPQFSSMQNDGDMFLVSLDGKLGWTDKDGKITINPQFTQAYPFEGNTLAAVQSNSSWGYIDKDGKIQINPQFDRAFPFNDKMALVLASNKVGFINQDGKYVINPQFDGAPNDLAIYYLNGGTSFGTVQSDFFNIGAIVSRIKFDLPEGISLDSPISTILSKFKIDTNRFDKGAAQTQLISSEKITPEASLNFYILGSPWVTYQTQLGSGWNQYTGTAYKFNNRFKPNGLMYTITLSGRGYYKESLLKTALEQSLVGYTKDTNESSGTMDFYRNAKQSVRIIFNNGTVQIIIGPYVSDKALADSTALGD